MILIKENTAGAFTIILNETEEKLLLVKRRDVPLWDLPGGRIDFKEKPMDCAIREAFEETGFRITITKVIGKYDRAMYNDTQYVFVGSIQGGTPIKDGLETAKLKWFSLNHLPCLMIPNRKRQIVDYLKGWEDIDVSLKDSKAIFYFQKYIMNEKGI